ncbi:hypothetical protein AMTRI_Chr02g253690 [Amborella trichopoda]
MLLFHLVQALVIILEVGVSLLSMNSDAHSSDVFGVTMTFLVFLMMVISLLSHYAFSFDCRRNLLMGVSIGMTWRKGRNRWKKGNWSTPIGVKAPNVIDLRKQ